MVKKFYRLCGADCMFSQNENQHTIYDMDGSVKSTIPGDAILCKVRGFVPLGAECYIDVKEDE